MLGAGPDALRLHAAHEGDGEPRDQQRVLAVGLEVATPEGMAVEVERRPEQHVGVLGSRLVTEGRTDAADERRVERGAQRRSAREQCCRHAGEALAAGADRAVGDADRRHAVVRQGLRVPVVVASGQRGALVEVELCRAASRTALGSWSSFSWAVAAPGRVGTGSGAGDGGHLGGERTWPGLTPTACKRFHHDTDSAAVDHMQRSDGGGWMARQRGHGASADATIEDVASAAGVSVATVSRALRGLPNVAPETRARVAEAASRLRYQPDPHASRLAAGRTNAIGMAVPLLDRWFFGKIVAGVESALRERGYDLIVYEVDGEAALRRFLSEAAPYRKRTDGLIIADLVVPADLLDGLVSSGTVMVTIGDRTDHYSSVMIDNAAAAKLVMDHLIGLGHRRIGLIGGQPRPADPPGRPGPAHARRARGAERGRHRPGPHHVQTAGFTVTGGYRAMSRMLEHPDPPTAVFAFSDEMAIGAIRAARASTGCACRTTSPSPASTTTTWPGRST